MAITYTTSINKLKGAPLLNGKQNIVTEVEFDIRGVDGDYSKTVSGHIALDYNEDLFTEFSELTELEVTSWVESHPAYAVYCGVISNFIDNMKVPMDIGMDKPWI